MGRLAYGSRTVLAGSSRSNRADTTLIYSLDPQFSHDAIDPARKLHSPSPDCCHPVGWQSHPTHSLRCGGRRSDVRRLRARLASVEQFAFGSNSLADGRGSTNSAKSFVERTATRRTSRCCRRSCRTLDASLFRAITTSNRISWSGHLQVVFTDGRPDKEACQYRLRDIHRIENPIQSGVFDAQANRTPNQRLVAANKLLRGGFIARSNAAHEHGKVFVLIH